MLGLTLEVGVKHENLRRKPQFNVEHFQGGTSSTALYMLASTPTLCRLWRVAFWGGIMNFEAIIVP
ncbi:hypothetical protein I7I50_00547 [Histoplasma capsulatum G186AR]|uniref:Uncharacterized protein n=1 Tax=Ajellomyces capsulatus TaxID=5037 RepID=A0A8H7YFU8_AJECA|nr:hypothetical protein I7I52_07815 [Histoplasma capsulatum]QSS72635.1 hypothetical protein I7I50_00547 [Histoplasma capsulatum G186AR]